MNESFYDPVNKIWSGPKVPTIFNPNQSLGRLILKILQQTPDSVTQIIADTDSPMTCKEMHDRTIKLAKFLLKTGIKQNERVGFVTANTENLAPAVFACFTLGLPINPLSPIMNENDIIQIYSKVKPKIIFCDAENLKVVQNAVNEMKSDAVIITVMYKVEGYECVSNLLKEMERESIKKFE